MDPLEFAERKYCAFVSQWLSGMAQLREAMLAVEDSDATFAATLRQLCQWYLSPRFQLSRSTLCVQYTLRTTTDRLATFRISRESSIRTGQFSAKSLNRFLAKYLRFLAFSWFDCEHRYEVIRQTWLGESTQTAVAVVGSGRKLCLLPPTPITDLFTD